MADGEHQHHWVRLPSRRVLGDNAGSTTVERAKSGSSPRVSVPVAEVFDRRVTLPHIGDLDSLPGGIRGEPIVLMLGVMVLIR